MRFWLFLAAFMTFSLPAQANMTVYELFTARDCPSCPRADELFGQITRANPQIIALACHVTYFDRPGRADSLSAPFCDGRQTGYKQGKVLDRIYTPAAVVNGMYAVKGNDKDSVMAGLSSSGAIETVKSIRLSAQGGYLNITLPGVSVEEPADVWLFAYNKGNAVTFLTKLMRWNGKAVAMAFPIGNVPATGYAVVAQTAAQTQILAAGKTN
ncbi:MAG: DUF1223 domain-containing protein [Alphaproteobacteria bacterium PRO2]|nr:DUF1223 domain-containing protein [Alphaproteobacteria bacterium PRO2]